MRGLSPNNEPIRPRGLGWGGGVPVIFMTLALYFNQLCSKLKKKQHTRVRTCICTRPHKYIHTRAHTTPDFCYRIVVFKRTGVFIIVSVPICIYKNVTKYLKIICRADFFIFTHFLMGRWWLLCTTLCSSKLRFGYQ